MATADQIKDAYIDYVLTHDEEPKSVYAFAKKLKITEASFYDHFTSFASIEKNIWVKLTSETIAKIKDQGVWTEFSSREKLLSFFYSYLENLKSARSFIIFSLKKKEAKFSTPTALGGAKPIFELFAEEVINEGLETGELADRKFFAKRYKDALWIQFVFILNFWVNDTSEGFEKTDEAIEKGINVTFDLFQRSPIDNLLEYGKFLSRNGKFSEKMRQ
ncbi:AcrR family transcriptional regulator [Pedobacter sp. UYP30]|uniref:TetR family transcriptional regulator C-terminal domain-containing protein n=1 Tax=Pedobacter sp. UYP30 TaxID=1756400 RepID=UPI0033953852